MSDFLLATREGAQCCLASALRKIYDQSPPEVFEFKGDWGRLAASQGHYRGFDPLETDTHICVVVGGPVLCFQGNHFLVGPNSSVGTRAILHRILAGTMSWGTDLDGPFAVLLIDKVNKSVTCVTDLMMFIPVYEYFYNGKAVLGTHVDAVAVACGKRKDFDAVSLVDFIVHDVVTYPYTAYQEVRQLMPAAIHDYSVAGELTASKTEPSIYWRPIEEASFASIGEAAGELRSGLEKYVGRITAGMESVAQFISGGEDSRALAGLLPSRLKRDAFIFLDRMNREGKVAESVANAYGAAFHVAFRPPTHYLEILDCASALIGLGHQYNHAHALGFHEQQRLCDYHAVFGGYLSDSLLKGAYARKPRGYGRFPFLPQVSIGGESRSRPVQSEFFKPELLRRLEQRRRSHLQRVQEFRPHTAHEWFVLWPMTMRTAIPNFYSTRRLFASYEPFMSNAVAKVSAAVPTSWKLNRRLFRAMARPLLEPARAIQHADGRYPHLPWYVNSPIQASVWTWRVFERKLLRKGTNEGPWCDWATMGHTSIWAEQMERARSSQVLQGLFHHQGSNARLTVLDSLPRMSQVNAFQVAVSAA